MKIKLLVLLFTLMNVSVLANNEYDVRENGNSFSLVDTLCVTPEIAYNNAQNWVVKSSSSYKGSVQFEDREQKKLIIKSGVVYPYVNASNEEPYLIFDLTIELKEGRFRLKLENIKLYTILHSVNFGFGETGEDTSEVDIVTFSCYEKNVISGITLFRYEEEYLRNKLNLEELRNDKNTTKKKKELLQIESDIKRIENRQTSIDEWRNNYIKINSTINSYISLLIKQLNAADDF